MEFGRFCNSRFHDAGARERAGGRAGGWPDDVSAARPLTPHVDTAPAQQAHSAPVPLQACERCTWTRRLRAKQHTRRLREKEKTQRGSGRRRRRRRRRSRLWHSDDELKLASSIKLAGQAGATMLLLRWLWSVCWTGRWAAWRYYIVRACPVSGRIDGWAALLVCVRWRCWAGGEGEREGGPMHSELLAARPLHAAKQRHPRRIRLALSTHIYSLLARPSASVTSSSTPRSPPPPPPPPHSPPSTTTTTNLTPPPTPSITLTQTCRGKVSLIALPSSPPRADQLPPQPMLTRGPPRPPAPPPPPLPHQLATDPSQPDRHRQDRQGGHLQRSRRQRVGGLRGLPGAPRPPPPAPPRPAPPRR